MKEPLTWENISIFVGSVIEPSSGDLLLARNEGGREIESTISEREKE